MSHQLIKGEFKVLAARRILLLAGDQVRHELMLRLQTFWDVNEHLSHLLQYARHSKGILACLPCSELRIQNRYLVKLVSLEGEVEYG